MTTATDNATTKNTIVKSSVTATCRILRTVLLASLTEAKGYVASKHPTLSSVSLTFSDAGVLKLIATDITRWYMDELTVDDVVVGGATGFSGAVTVACDAKRLHDVVKAMDADETVLTLKGTLTKTVTTVVGSKTGPRIEHESLVQAFVPRNVALTLARAAVAPGSALSQNVSTTLDAVAAVTVSVTWLPTTTAARAPPS